MKPPIYCHRPITDLSVPDLQRFMSAHNVDTTKLDTHLGYAEETAIADAIAFKLIQERTS